MPIVAADLVQYGAVNHPENDTDLVGGDRSATTRIKDLVLAANDTLEILSSAAGDTTQTVTVKGRDATGVIITDTKTLNGTTPVAIVGTFERVSHVSKSAATTGTVTLRRTGAGATVVTLEPAILKVIRHFYDSASEAGATTRFEKSFWQNDHATLTLSAADITLTADPSAVIRIGLATATNDTATAANRKTAPAGVTFSDDNVVLSVPGGDLIAAERIGTWAELQLTANHAALKSSFTTRCRGTTV